jgi:hypothetical protein
MIEMMSGMSMGSFGLVMMLSFAVLIILPFWFIFSKAGFPRWLSLLMVVPIVNVIMLWSSLSRIGRACRRRTTISVEPLERARVAGSDAA